MSRIKLINKQKKNLKLLQQKLNSIEVVKFLRKPSHYTAAPKNLLYNCSYDDGNWKSIFRYFNVSSYMKFKRQQKSSQAFISFWNILSPQLLKNQGMLKSLLARVTNYSSSLELSRSINTPSWSDTDKISEKENPSEEEVESIEHTLLMPDYQLESSSLESSPSPAQRCRLCCPLPPEEFLPPERSEYIPNYQSPNVKYGILHSFFGPKEDPEKFGGSEYVMKPPVYLQERIDLMNKTETPKEEKQETPATPSSPVTSPVNSLDMPESIPDNIKKRKYYSTIESKKPQENDFVEVPQMNALLFNRKDKSLQYMPVDIPASIFKDEVLVQVSYSGVSGFDLSLTEGKIPCRKDIIIPGREISGEVYAVGSDVGHVKPGDNVVINAHAGCSICRYCSKGLSSSCLNDELNNSLGVSKNGGWAEFVVVKKSQVHKIPEELGLDQAVLVLHLSCILSAMKRLKLSYDTTVLIQGLGLSGNLWASVLNSRGFRNVLVSDQRAKRINQFETLNLQYPFIPLEDIQKYSADVVVECTGTSTSIENALQILNRNGQICLFGRPKPNSEIRFRPYEIMLKEISIVGNTGSSYCFSEAIDLATVLARGDLNLEKLGVEVFPLKDYERAFQLIKFGQIGKIIFKPDS